MNNYGTPAPPRTLAQRLERLNDNLQTLGERLKASIAGLLGDTIADAARDAVRGLLGGEESPPDPYRDDSDHHARGRYRDRRDYPDGADDPWGGEDGRWSDDYYSPSPPRASSRPRSGTGRRWRDALSAAVQTCLWFIR